MYICSSYSRPISATFSCMPNQENAYNQNEDREGVAHDEPPLHNVTHNVHHEQVHPSVKHGTSDNLPESNLGKNIKEYNLVSTIANVIMALGTTVAVVIAFYSLKSSNEALELTRNSLKSGDVKDKAMIEYSRQMAQANIDLVKEVRDEFKIGNEPFLQMEINFTYVNESLYIGSKLVNYGKMPVYTDTIWITTICASHHVPTIREFVDAAKDNSKFANHQFIGLNQPITFPDIIVSNDKLNLMAQYPTYVGGYVVYTNLITKKRRKYVVTLCIPPKFKVYHHIRNENYDLDK